MHSLPQKPKKEPKTKLTEAQRQRIKEYAKAHYDPEKKRLANKKYNDKKRREYQQIYYNMRTVCDCGFECSDDYLPFHVAYTYHQDFADLNKLADLLSQNIAPNQIRKIMNWS